MDAATETLELRNGRELWARLEQPDRRAGARRPGTDKREREAVQPTLNNLVGERAGLSGVARLTCPVNIGIGTN